MSSDPSAQSNGITLKFPTSLDLKDLIAIVSIAITLTAAWGVFSTRITVVERELISLREDVRAQAQAADKTQQQVSKLNAQQQDDALLIDQIYTILRKPIPLRRAPN